MQQGFGIYLHWPFCASKCPYCDFNSHVSARIDPEAWAHAYSKELDRVRAEIGQRQVSSIFFGGGTPSLMPPSLVETILQQIQALWPLSPDCEITLEANPGSVEADRFAGFAKAGVNRVSLGVQALNDEDLARLGRLHSAEDAIRAMEIARESFDRVSFDLIYGRQDQGLSAWEEELHSALAMAPDHLSLYMLTIEDGTAFAQRHAHGKLKGLPGEDLAADLYERTNQLCEAAGLPAYEISNHARPGSESRHNLLYWRSEEWAGIGPGAHGRLELPEGRTATEAIRAPSLWLEAALGEHQAEKKYDYLSSEEKANEYLMMSLRLSEGLDISRFEQLGGKLNKDRLDTLIAERLMQRTNYNVKATLQGRLLLNQLIAELAI